MTTLHLYTGEMCDLPPGFGYVIVWRLPGYVNLFSTPGVITPGRYWRKHTLICNMQHSESTTALMLQGLIEHVAKCDLQYCVMDDLLSIGVVL